MSVRVFSFTPAICIVISRRKNLGIQCCMGPAIQIRIVILSKMSHRFNVSIFRNKATKTLIKGITAYYCHDDIADLEPDLKKYDEEPERWKDARTKIKLAKQFSKIHSSGSDPYGIGNEAKLSKYFGKGCTKQKDNEDGIIEVHVNRALDDV